MADQRLLDFGSDLLDGLVTYLTTTGIDVPTHRYVHVGEIAHDFTEENCADALVVSFDGIIEGSAGQAGNPLPGSTLKCAVSLVAQWTVALLRCVPVIEDGGEPPSAADLEASATDLLVDGMELANAVVDLYLNSSCSLRSIGTLVPIGPSGGAGGFTMTIFGELS